MSTPLDSSTWDSGSTDDELVATPVALDYANLRDITGSGSSTVEQFDVVLEPGVVVAPADDGGPDGAQVFWRPDGSSPPYKEPWIAHFGLSQLGNAVGRIASDPSPDISPLSRLHYYRERVSGDSLRDLVGFDTLRFTVYYRKPTEYYESAEDKGYPWLWEIRTPYAWQYLDLAKLIWTLIRFHSTASAGGASYVSKILDKESFLVTSALACSNPYYHHSVSLGRKAGKSFGHTINEVLRGTRMEIGQGAFVDGVFRLCLAIRYTEGAEQLTVPIDLDSQKAQLGAPNMEEDFDLIVNSVEFDWGDVQFDRTDTQPLTYQTLPSVGRSHVQHLEDEDSHARYGRRDPVQLVARYTHDEDGVGAAIPLRFGAAPLRLVLNMGPLHWDFQVGERVTFTSSVWNITSSMRWRCVRKSVDPNTMGAICDFVRILSVPAMRPDHPLIYERLWVWLKEGGKTMTGSEVDVWADSGKWGHDATALGHGTGDKGVQLTNYHGALDVVEFWTFDATQRGIELAGLGLEDVALTLIAVVHINELPSSTTQVLFATDAPAGTVTLKLGIHFDGGGDPRLGYYDSTGWHLAASKDLTIGRYVICWRLKSREPQRGDIWLNGEWLELDDNEVNANSGDGFDLDDDVTVGINEDGSTESWRGVLAEFALYHSWLQPHLVRMVTKHLADKWGATLVDW